MNEQFKIREKKN